MKRIASSVACLGLFAPLLPATSISFVGLETGSVVQNWWKKSVVKALDLDADHRYGGAGYFQITPRTLNPEEIANTWSDIAVSGNDLGITPISMTEWYPTLFATPSFITSVPSGGAGNYVNSDTYQQFVTPYSSETLRQGVLAVTIPEDVENEGTPPGGDPGRWCNAFTFTLSKNANFRLGVAVDTGTFIDAENPLDASNAPDYVSVSKVNGAEEFSVALSRNGVPDMVFFDITGNADEVFSVRLWQTTDETGGPIAFALVTFDQLTTPLPTLSQTRVGKELTLSWELGIPGWILESSTDLGIADIWYPVLGVENNSVTLDTTNVPKNFFRLRNDP
jgi:hypothetical protein